MEEWLDLVIDPEDEDRVEMYSDPDLTLYEAFGFSWQLSPGDWHVPLIKLYAKFHTSSPGEVVPLPFTISGVSMGDYKFRKYVAGDNAQQQGGDVVLDRENKLVNIYPMKSVNDRPNIEEVLSA